MGQYFVEILEFQSEQTAEIGTSTTQIKLTGHGLTALDFIVNETKRTTSSERGARLVYSSGLDADTIPIETPITGQIVGNHIRLYKFIDRTGKLRPGTFRLVRRSAGLSELSFEIVTDADYIPKPGQYIRIRYHENGASSYRFYGVITGTQRHSGYDGSDKIFMSVSCTSMKQIATRRTISINKPAGTTMGSIVTEMVDSYLYQDGVRKSIINTGATLDEDWQDDVLSISEILDQCASKSGYQWFIDDNGLMNFYQDDGSIQDAAHILDSSGAWDNYTNVNVEQSIENYVNKVFLAGGTDENGNPIIFGAENFTGSTEMQENFGGTGVFGTVVRDTSVTESDYRTVESGSNTTTINMTGHGLSVNDVVWNYTRDEYRQILTVPTANQFTVDAFSNLSARTSATAGAGTTTTNVNITAHGITQVQVDGAAKPMIYNATRNAYRFIVKVIDANNFTVETISGQASGDTIHLSGDIIVFFNEANTIIKNTIKKQGTFPQTLTFETEVNDFEPNTKLYAHLPILGIAAGYYLIEDIEVYDKGAGLSNTWCKIKATLRDNSNFSTQRSKNYADFWGGF